ncbi:hypothetical protein T439DRAFT_187623 [Meredithblackwellia eburnea MCA 4105]
MTPPGGAPAWGRRQSIITQRRMSSRGFVGVGGVGPSSLSPTSVTFMTTGSSGSTSPTSTERLLSDHSHTSSHSAQEVAPFHTRIDVQEFSEKDLQDAFQRVGGISNPSINSNSRNHVPKWAARLSGSASPTAGTYNTPRFGRALFSRRTLILVVLATASIVSICSIINTTLAAIAHSDNSKMRKGYMEGLVDDAGKLKSAAVHAVQGLAWEFKAKPTVYEPLPISEMINFVEPQETLRIQLKQGVRYLTALAYGGHANQFISIGKLLYLGKLLNRVVLIPTLLPVHFDAPPANFSDFFDLPRFYHDAQIPALEFSTVKSIGKPGSQQNEGLSCWSTQEVTVGHANLQEQSLDVHNIWVDHWAMPQLSRGLGGHDIAFDSMRMFDFEEWARKDWIARVKEDMLPQQSENFEGDKRQNLKVGFDPINTPPPDDQIMCLDNTLFLGPVMFPPAFTGDIPLEPAVPGEGLSWMGATQFIHFTQQVEDVADEYLMGLFGVTSPSRIPPFISVHLRRGDFKEFAGLTALEKYQAAVNRVVANLQQRLDDPEAWRGPGKANFRHFGIPARKYQVLTTTDEPTGSPFIDEVRALGWKVLDHGALNTAQERGGWWPTILDAAILARGQSFVGTDRSTFSHLAGLRVKYWHGGLVDIAV